MTTGIAHVLLGAYLGPPPTGFSTLSIRREITCTTWRMLGGKVRVRFGDGTTRELRAGQWAFLDPYVERGHRFSPDARLLSIRFQLLRDGVPIPLGCAPAAPPDPTLEARLLEAGKALVEAREAYVASPECLVAACRQEAAFHDWLASWHEHRGPLGIGKSATGDPRAADLVALLAQQIGAGPIDYEPLRSATGLSRSQVDRLFRSSLGTTPRRWCEHALLGRVQRELATTRRPLKELAYAHGFADPAYFSRWFRDLTGRTPGDFRRGG